MTWGHLASAVHAAAASQPRALEAALEPTTTPADRLRATLTQAQLTRVGRNVGMTIPALRIGHAKVTKMPGTWPLRLWSGDRLDPAQPAWLSNPDPRTTFTHLVAETLDDALWRDVAYWRVTRRGRDGYPLAFERLTHDQVADDGRNVRILDDDLAARTPDAKVLADGRVLESVLVFRWDGLGGLAGAGAVILDLALALLAAAGNYARSPLPSTTMVADPAAPVMDDAEVDEMLARWEQKRAERSTAYVRGMTPSHAGFSAKELQLVEAREHSALEVARALALPAWAVGAANGASLEYSTTVENRRDLVEALRLWTAPVEQTLSLHAAPRGKEIRHDVTSYLRDDPATRMATWASGLASGALTLPEVRAAEPLATEGTTP